MEPTISLDDVRIYKELDPGGMIEAVEGFPDQCLEARRLASEPGALPYPEEIREIAILGMGGSAIGGDVIRVLLEEEIRRRINVHRGYRLPGFYAQETLVFAVSYSGNTEETLSAVEQAAAQGCRIVALTSGGSLLAMARDRDWPAVEVPMGMQPRAALAYLTIPIAVVMERIGLVSSFSQQLEEAVESMRKRVSCWGRIQPQEQNFAKQLAARLCGKIPVVYGTEGPLSVAAYRWKCQFNENSKSPAFHHVLPEMNHNEVVGWDRLDDFTRRVEAIFLVDEEGDARMIRRVEITSELIKENLGGVSVVHVRGNSPVEKLFVSILLGDFVSVYLALLRGKNPTPVEKISELKEQLSTPG